MFSLLLAGMQLCLLYSAIASTSANSALLAYYRKVELSYELVGLYSIARESSSTVLLTSEILHLSASPVVSSVLEAYIT